MAIYLVVVFFLAVLYQGGGHGVQVAVLAILGQQFRGDIVRGNGYDYYVVVEVEVSLDGYCCSPSLELLEGKLWIRIPIKALVLAGKLHQ